MIHPTAIISNKALISDNINIGKFDWVSEA